MAKSSLIVTTEDHITGNTQQKTITDINPQANDAHLKTWGQMVAGLSKDSYVKSDRVDKRNLDTDSKLDYPATIQTWNMRQADGTNSFGTVTSDDLQLNVSAFQSEAGSGLPFRLGGLSEYNVPGITVTNFNDNFQVQHRSTTYGGPQHVQAGLRGTWDINLYVIGTVTAGDSFTVKVNILGDATHNPYERTIKFTFVEWTAPEEGGEG